MRHVFGAEVPWPLAKECTTVHAAGRMPADAGARRVLTCAGWDGTTPWSVEVLKIEYLRPTVVEKARIVDDGLVEAYGAGRYVDPPVVDGLDRVLDGHARVASAAAAGHAWMFVVRMGEEAAKAGNDPAPEPDLSDKDIAAALRQELGDAAHAAMREAMNDGGELQADALGINWRSADPRVVEALKWRKTNLERVVDQYTARAVRDTLAAGYKASDTERDLIRRLSAGGMFSKERAQRIARTETHNAVMGGAFAAMEQAGVTGKQWLSAIDARPTHREANGQYQDLADPFEVGDAELMYPGDPVGGAGYPEEVVNCRCTLLTVRDPTTPDDVADELDVQDMADAGLDDSDFVDSEAELPASDFEISQDEIDAIRTRIAEAARDELTDDEVAQVDMEEVDPITVRVDSNPDEAYYDPDLGLASIGEDATAEQVADVLREHMVASLLTAADAGGFENELALYDLPAVHGPTPMKRAVSAISRIVVDDREGLEALLDRAIDDDEWDMFRAIGAQFWVGGGNQGPIPVDRSGR